MKGRRIEKLTEQFMDLYKIKKIILTNTVKLELPLTIKIHLVVNISRVQLYRPQVKGQKVVPLQPVVIDEKKEYEIEKILNRKKVQEKNKFLVQQKKYTVEADIWEGKKNLEIVKELVKKFKREYRKEAKDVR